MQKKYQETAAGGDSSSSSLLKLSRLVRTAGHQR